MNLKIFNHDKVSSYKPSNNIKAVMIRAVDPHSQLKELIYKDLYEDILEIRFHDYTLDRYNELNLWGSNIKIFSYEDAIKIVDFFENNIDADEIVIHCEEGRSRSSGIAISFCRFIGDEEEENKIWNNLKYIPNLTVIDMIDNEVDKRKYNN